MTPNSAAPISARSQADNDKLNAADMTPRELAVWKYRRYMERIPRHGRRGRRQRGSCARLARAIGPRSKNTIVVYTSRPGILPRRARLVRQAIHVRTVAAHATVDAVSRSHKARHACEGAGAECRLCADFPRLRGTAEARYRAGPLATPWLPSGRSPANWRKDVYYHYYEYPGFHSVRAHYGVRTDRYKLIRFYGDINNGSFTTSRPIRMRCTTASMIQVRPIVTRLPRRALQSCARNTKTAMGRR